MGCGFTRAGNFPRPTTPPRPAPCNPLEGAPRRSWSPPALSDITRAASDAPMRRRPRPVDADDMMQPRHSAPSVVRARPAFPVPHTSCGHGLKRGGAMGDVKPLQSIVACPPPALPPPPHVHLMPEDWHSHGALLRYADELYAQQLEADSNAHRRAALELTRSWPSVSSPVTPRSGFTSRASSIRVV